MRCPECRRTEIVDFRAHEAKYHGGAQIHFEPESEREAATHLDYDHGARGRRFPDVPNALEVHSKAHGSRVY